MKKITLLILMSLIVLSGCSVADLGKIQIINDELDNSKVVLLQVVYNSSDTGLSNYKALITYSKKMKENEPLTTTVNFKIKTNLKESGLTQKCYLVAGDQKYELTLSNISTKTDTFTETHQERLDGSVDVYTYTAYIMEGELSLTPDMTEQMKNSTKLTYRLYLGTRPLTFEVSDKALTLVKTFIETK